MLNLRSNHCLAFRFYSSGPRLSSTCIACKFCSCTLRPRRYLFVSRLGASIQLQQLHTVIVLTALSQAGIFSGICRGSEGCSNQSQDSKDTSHGHGFVQARGAWHKKNAWCTSDVCKCKGLESLLENQPKLKFTGDIWMLVSFD
ncbi:unnamed protein product [Polarella glacialis]|uniref:Uncharacterized protein n=1 Tax=Polarella glacialis TaxID=89957 RepID=A0A813DYG2_POLGL|nr:unnamed protein product [Polarella glacialis]